MIGCRRFSEAWQRQTTQCSRAVLLSILEYDTSLLTSVKSSSLKKLAATCIQIALLERLLELRSNSNALAK